MRSQGRVMAVDRVSSRVQTVPYCADALRFFLQPVSLLQLFLAVNWLRKLLPTSRCQRAPCCCRRVAGRALRLACPRCCCCWRRSSCWSWSSSASGVVSRLHLVVAGSCKCAAAVPVVFVHLFAQAAVRAHAVACDEKCVSLLRFVLLCVVAVKRLCSRASHCLLLQIHADIVSGLGGRLDLFLLLVLHQSAHQVALVHPARVPARLVGRGPLHCLAMWSRCVPVCGV